MNPILSAIWKFVKTISMWSWNNKSIAGYIILIIIISFLSWKNNRNEIKISELSITKGELEERLKNQTVITNNKIVYRDKDKVVIRYLPSEGRVVVNETKDGKTEVIVKNRGLTIKLGAGILYSGNYENVSFNPTLDLKLLYWNRYSGGIGSSLNYPFLYFSRHIDDLTMGQFKNIELMLAYGKPYAEFEKSILGIGVRGNF